MFTLLNKCSRYKPGRLFILPPNTFLGPRNDGPRTDVESYLYAPTDKKSDGQAVTWIDIHA